MRPRPPFTPINPPSTTVSLPSNRFPPPRSFLNCSPPSFCPLAPGRWWWSEPRRCWRRRKGRRQSTPRKRWTSPSCSLGSDPGSHKSRRPNASAPWWERGGRRKGEGSKDVRRKRQISAVDSKMNLLRPPLSGGNGKECEKSPGYIVVVEVALPPLSLLCLDFVVAFVHQKLAPRRQESGGFEWKPMPTVTQNSTNLFVSSIYLTSLQRTCCGMLTSEHHGFLKATFFNFYATTI